MSLISRKKEKIFAKGVIGNVRKAQEDSYGWKLGTPNGDLFVVCDGMGGHVGGAMASKIAVDKDKLLSNFYKINNTLVNHTICNSFGNLFKYILLIHIL